MKSHDKVNLTPLLIPNPKKSFNISKEKEIYESFIELDFKIKVGDFLSQIHFPDNPQKKSKIYKTNISGILIGKTHNSLVDKGDFLTLIGELI